MEQTDQNALDASTQEKKIHDIEKLAQTDSVRSQERLHLTENSSVTWNERYHHQIRRKREEAQEAGHQRPVETAHKHPAEKSKPGEEDLGR